MTAPGLIAVDLDGTLFLPHTADTSAPRISARTVAALQAARDAGWHVVPATGRAAHGLDDLLAPLGHDGPLVVCNGAAALTADGQVLFEEHLDATMTTRVVDAYAEHVPGTRFGVVRDAGRLLVVEPEYAGLVRSHREHLRDPDDLDTAELADLLRYPCVNVVLRHPQVGPRRLADLLPTLGVDGVVAMYSNDAVLEVQRAGVSKATAIARLCERLGLSAAHVVAFGDSDNDRELLAWAGRGVAMGNGTDAVRAIADEVTLPNAYDGVAVVVERLLDGVPRA